VGKGFPKVGEISARAAEVVGGIAVVDGAQPVGMGNMVASVFGEQRGHLGEGSRELDEVPSGVTEGTEAGCGRLAGGGKGVLEFPAGAR
jgi:hypothetical protein